MRDWNSTFLFMTTVITMAITAISLVIMINQRRYDIAVLRSLGMGKIKIILKFLIEKTFFVAALSLVSFVLSQSIFYFIVKPFTERATSLPLTDISMTEVFMQSAVWLVVSVGIIMGLALLITVSYILTFQPLKIFNKKD
jgi:ABC-type antimicrobial peptide transport system permease subunit